ncbi:MAG: hypothetical protein ABI041_04345 [Bdellovibrionia bacterium]
MPCKTVEHANAIVTTPKIPRSLVRKRIRMENGSETFLINWLIGGTRDSLKPMLSKK